MKKIKLTMTGQQTQFIFAILSKSELNNIDSLEKLLACAEILQPVAREYEDKAGEIFDQIKGREQELQTIPRLQGEKWTEETKKAEYEKVQKEIEDLQEKMSKTGQENHAFEIDGTIAVAMNTFLSEYLKAGTRFGGDQKMREMLSIPGLKIIGNTMSQLAPAVKEILEKVESSK